MLGVTFTTLPLIEFCFFGGLFTVKDGVLLSDLACFWTGVVVRCLLTVLGSYPFFPQLLLCLLGVRGFPAPIAGCMARFRVCAPDSLAFTMFMLFIAEATYRSAVVSSFGLAELPLP